MALLALTFVIVKDSEFYQRTENLIIIGSNFTKADSDQRSRIAISKGKAERVRALAKHNGLSNFILLSTCNRTEFIACATLTKLKGIVFEALGISREFFDTHFYTYTSQDAVKHFFRVTSGLDSQILGDYEIVGQVKNALQLSREHRLVGTLLDRIGNFAFQAQKEIKKCTTLSSGKYSVSYAATELIGSRYPTNSAPGFLVVGTGNFGKAMARQLKAYFPSCSLTFTNRTLSNAQELAAEMDGEYIPFDSFKNHLSSFDAVVTTTESDEYIIRTEDVQRQPSCLFLDLSIPQAIDPAARSLPTASVFSIDDVSSFHNALLSQRSSDIPRAEQILHTYITHFQEWAKVYSHRHIILKYREKAESLSNTEAFLNAYNPTVNGNPVEQSISSLIQKIRADRFDGCTFIRSMNELITHS